MEISMELINWHVHMNMCLFPELTIEELVFLHCKYYSIFLLQQEVGAL
jgi:hypothetical protein